MVDLDQYELRDLFKIRDAATILNRYCLPGMKTLLELVAVAIKAKAKDKIVM